MRRLLRDIAEGRELGDVTTLRDPDVMAQLEGKVKERQARGRAELPELTERRGAAGGERNGLRRRRKLDAPLPRCSLMPTHLLAALAIRSRLAIALAVSTRPRPRQPDVDRASQSAIAQFLGEASTLAGEALAPAGDLNATFASLLLRRSLHFFDLPPSALSSYVVFGLLGLRAIHLAALARAGSASMARHDERARRSQRLETSTATGATPSCRRAGQQP